MQRNYSVNNMGLRIKSQESSGQRTLTRTSETSICFYIFRWKDNGFMLRKPLRCWYQGVKCLRCRVSGVSGAAGLENGQINQDRNYRQRGVRFRVSGVSKGCWFGFYLSRFYQSWPLYGLIKGLRLNSENTWKLKPEHCTKYPLRINLKCRFTRAPPSRPFLDGD